MTRVDLVYISNLLTNTTHKKRSRWFIFLFSLFPLARCTLDTFALNIFFVTLNNLPHTFAKQQLQHAQYSTFNKQFLQLNLTSIH